MKVHCLSVLLILVLLGVPVDTTEFSSSRGIELSVQSLEAWKQPLSVSTEQPRLLAGTTRSAMRITIESTTMTTVITPATGTDPTTQAGLNFILRAMNVAASFYSKRLKVTPLSTVKSPSTCGGITPPLSDRTSGRSNTDLLVHLVYVTDKTIGYGANGIACAFMDATTTIADPTLQRGRPIVGRISFNTYNVVDGKVLTNRLFSKATGTALHEFLHILGFDASKFSFWLDQTTQLPYSSGTITGDVTTSASRSSRSKILKTPYVKHFVETYFGCTTLGGMLLENEDGAANDLGSHWERLAIYDELMTGTDMSPTKSFTALTFAAMKDMGWYAVDDTFYDTTSFGKNKGCTFLQDACFASGVTYPQFCTASQLTNVYMCTNNFMSKARCLANTVTQNYMSDGCGLQMGYFDCVDETNSDDGYKRLTLDKYGVESICILSSFGTSPVNPELRSRCYPFTCNSDARTITFTISSSQVVCLENEEGATKTVSSMQGTLTCPNYPNYCENNRKLCPNWCSMNGFCMGGICNCLTGYSGIDCSVTSCTEGTYYYANDGTCRTTCPSKTYANKYCSTCLPCAANCQQCRDQPQLCSSCLAPPGVVKYLFNGNCVDACPDGYFAQADVCVICSAAANCAKCVTTATKCTACANGKYLQNPDFGACVTTCGFDGNGVATNFPLKDIVNFKCRANCDGNLVTNSAAGQCQLCDLGKFKVVAQSPQCQVSCPPKFYPNSATRACTSCETSCLTCNGPFAENCISCDPAKSLYLLLSMCVSVCPRGYYASTGNDCLPCSPQLNCGSCKIISTVLKCTTCATGYYQQPDGSCLRTCATNRFTNKWAGTCDLCDLNCLTCSSGSKSSCLTCDSNKYFLANMTGGYCLDACPVVQYVRSGANCLSCYPTCQSCIGITSKDCSTCISGLYLSQGYCRYVCPAKSFPQSQKSTCDACNNNCTFCFGPTNDNCTACIKSLYLNNFTCIKTCPAPLTPNQWGVCWGSKQQVQLLMSIVTLIALVLY